MAKAAAPAPKSAAVIPFAGVSPMSWPIAGDVPDLNAIIDDQAATIAAQAALIDAYQANLNSAQNPPAGTPATGTGSAASSTSVNMATVSGTIVVGATVTGVTGVPAGTKVLGQISGTTGGVGVYLTNNPVNVSSATLTFTPPAPAGTWPTPQDPPTLMSIQQSQSAVLRYQSALIQQYQDLLNVSQTPAPPSGP